MEQCSWLHICGNERMGGERILVSGGASLLFLPHDKYWRPVAVIAIKREPVKVSAMRLAGSLAGFIR